MTHPVPSFDIWTIIFLFAALQGLFVSAVLFQIKRENRFGNRLLAFLLVLLSLTLIDYVLYWTNYQFRFIHFTAFSTTFFWLIGPLLFFYFRYSFENKRFALSDGLHLLPFLLHLLFDLVTFRLKTGAEKFDLMQHAPDNYAQLLLLTLLPWLKMGHLGVYGVLMLQRYKRWAGTVQSVKHWFIWLMALYGCFIAANLSYYILVRFPFFSPEWDYMISFAMSFFIWFLSWFGYMQPDVFKGFRLNEIISKPKYQSSSLTPSAAYELAAQLDKLMAEHHIYRRNDLSLDALSQLLGTSKHSLSQILNEQKGQSFFDYVNFLRIEEAKQLLISSSKAELQIQDVAFMVGFNNKVTFNNTFKKLTGTTPSAWRKAQGEQGKIIPIAG
jgi:AraC-like DNA-binding protein